MTPDLPDARRLTVLSDHGQFYLADLGAHDDWMRVHATDPGLAPAGWTEEAVYGKGSAGVAGILVAALSSVTWVSQRSVAGLLPPR